MVGNQQQKSRYRQYWLGFLIFIGFMLITSMLFKSSFLGHWWIFGDFNSNYLSMQEAILFIIYMLSVFVLVCTKKYRYVAIGMICGWIVLIYAFLIFALDFILHPPSW
jgi:hypothetical protein